MKNIYIDNNKFQIICEQYNRFHSISIEDRIALSSLMNNKNLIPAKFQDRLAQQLNSIDDLLIEYVQQHMNTTKPANGYYIHAILRLQINLDSIVGLNKATSFSGWSLRLFIVMVSMLKRQGKLNNIHLSAFDNSKHKKNVTKLANQLKRFCDNNKIKYSYQKGILTIYPKTNKKIEETVKVDKQPVQSNEINRAEDTSNHDQFNSKLQRKQEISIMNKAFDLGESRFNRAKLIEIMEQFGGKEQFKSYCNNYYYQKFVPFCEKHEQDKTKLYRKVVPNFVLNIQQYLENNAIKHREGCTVINLSKKYISNGYIADKYADYIDQVRTQAFNYQQMLFQQLTDRYTRWYEDESINKLGKPIVDFLWISAVCMTCRCDIALDLIMLNF